LKKIVRAPGSATVVNAIATGCGSAFGINLDIIAKAKLIPSEIKCSSDIGADPKLMEYCAKEVIEYYGVKTGVKIETESALPQGSGLSSSSATSNAVVKALALLISEEFNLRPLNHREIINIAIDASLKAGVTITGAFDDASASYFGGITVTNNMERELIIKEKFQKQNILIYMSDKMSITANSDVKKMKLLSPLVAVAFDLACKRDYFKALNLNGLLYSTSLGFDTQIAMDALEAGAFAAGLSGTGSSFVAISDNQHKEDIRDVWSSYPGKVIETQVDNLGTQVIK